MDIAIQRVNNWIKNGDINSHLDLDRLKLNELPRLPDNLEQLYCSNNKLTSLPNNLPNNLKILNCSYNKLTSLPDLHSLINLEELNCSDNYNLTNLPDLPPNLKELYCSFCELTKLPSLPETLYVLYCRGNPLKFPIKIPINVTKTDIFPSQYIKIKPKNINIKDIDEYLPSDISNIIDDYLGSSCDMLSEYGDRCGYKTQYTKSYVDKDGKLIDTNKQEIDTLIKYGIIPKIVTKKYNCVNYCKQHCDLGISKILDYENKIINIYDNNDNIINRDMVKLTYKIKNDKGTEEKIDLIDICKTKNNYYIELFIPILYQTEIPNEYKITFEENDKEVRYVSSSKWKLIEKEGKVFAFMGYDLIYEGTETE